MNFNLILLVLFILTGCGVKSNPVSPTEKAIPSYIDSYLKEDPNQQLKIQNLKK